jgi:transposase
MLSYRLIQPDEVNDMNKVISALRMLKEKDSSVRKASRVCQLSPSTISRYWLIYKKKNYDVAELEKLTEEEFSERFNPPRRHPLLIVQPDYAFHHRMLKRRDETLVRQWNLYRENALEKNVASRRLLSYSQFCRNYRQFAVKVDLAMRQVHRAGECVFVDFCGRTVPWTDPETGTVNQAQVFVAVMGCSSYLLFRAVPSQKVPFWIELHNWLYEKLGGVPQLTVPDNLKSAVIKAGREFVLNRTYADLANHFGTVIVPARPRKPKDKAAVENGVKLVRRWVLAALADRTFFSIAEINQAFDEYIRIVNDKPFRWIPGTRRSWFEELDKPALKPLPAEPYELAEWTMSQKVPKDYHVRVKNHFYSVPYTLVGASVQAKVTVNSVFIYQGGKLVATHARCDAIGQSTTLKEHRSPEHRFHADQTPEYFVAWARDTGPAALTVVQHQFDSHAHSALGLRACASLKKMARDLGNDRFEAACRRAERIGSMTVKSIRSILQAGLDKQTEDDVPRFVSIPEHRNVRGAEYYAGR